MRRIDYLYRPATIVKHCAVSGRMERRVRAFHVSAPESYAQHPVSICVAFIERRRRRGSYCHVVPDHIQYLTIEADGQVLYDSRQDVPCDMDAWHRTNDRFKARRGGIYVHGV